MALTDAAVAAFREERHIAVETIDLVAMAEGGDGNGGAAGRATIPRPITKFDQVGDNVPAALLKAAGYNAVRTSHNPPSPAFLDACDRMPVEAFCCCCGTPADFF